MIAPYRSNYPKIGVDCFVAPDAWVVGDVSVGAKVSIYFGAVLRGDIRPIRVGDGTNIQEAALLHTSKESIDCEVGCYVTVGHRAIIHSAKVGDYSLVGMGATILDNAEIGEYSIIGANSLVTSGTIIPPKVLALGSPAKVVRPLSENELLFLKSSALGYIERSQAYIELFGAPTNYEPNR